jgi:hypothetical protein
MAVGCTTDIEVPHTIDGGGGLDAPVNRANGSACSADEDCTSGICADGVCCTHPCTGTCMSCKVKTSMGTCVPVPDGQLPDPARGSCNAEAPSTCGRDGKCDGSGECRKFPEGSICADGRCEGSTVVGAKVCQGGACQAGPDVICTPFSCDPATRTCFDKCTGNAECDGRDCAGGSCGKKPLGNVCKVNAECDSGFCADGVCCNLACTGACVSCNQPGKMGECQPVAEGLPDEHKVCPADGPETCGSSGLCNGQGGCSKYAAGTVCKPSSCSGGSMIPASTCNGLGTCLLGSAITCNPYVCADNACKATCTTNADCVSPNTCVNGSCGQKGLGQKCNANADCKSKFCIDGVCCDQLCGDTCAYCALPNAPGRCTTVPAGVTDPRGFCKNGGPASCAANGKCNGSRACQKYPSGTVCKAGSCDGQTNRSIDESTCKNGVCTAPSPTSCNPYKCNGARCGTSCSTNTQCLGTNICVNGSCGTKMNGAVCSKNTDCKSSFCAQGVCCGTACTASCFSCSLPGSAGTCSPVLANGLDPTGTCKDQGAATCGNDGTCNGSGGCKKYTPGTVCVAAKCAMGSYTSESTCDGKGKCNAGSSRGCAPFVCNSGGTACFDSCTTSAQCMAPRQCMDGKCGLKDDGATCSDPSECKNGHCVDGFCCDTACTEVCKSCALTGKRGVCSAIPDDVADDGGGCVASPESSCGNDGKCNGAGACRKWGTSVECRAASCPSAGATVTKPATCDGKGTCPPGDTQSCGSYKCDTNNMCRTTCSSDADCNGKACDTTTGNCDKNPLGVQCSNNDQCASGHCVDNTCCSTAACGTCQTCANAMGSCKDVPDNMPDPDSCSDSMNACGTTGKCDGSGGCKLASAGTECGQMCVNDELVTKTCDGSGHCTGNGGTQPCHGFVCANDACVTTCDSNGNAGCVAPKVCVNNACEDPPPPPDGGM